MHPPPQWLLNHKTSEMKANGHHSGPSRPWRVLAASILWVGVFLNAHRRLELSGYLQAFTDGVGSKANRIMQSTEESMYSRSKQDDNNLLQEAQYFLNDPTIRLSPYVPRPWLRYHSSIAETNANATDSTPLNKPKRKLVLTQFGWNHPDTKGGLARFPRSLRMRELLQGFIDHPDFDPTFNWRHMVTGKQPIDKTLEYVVFPDVETCFESNYPMTVGEFGPNADTQQGRIVKKKWENPCLDITGCFQYINAILGSPLFQVVNASTLLYFDCRGFGPNAEFRRKEKSTQMSILSISTTAGVMLEDSDMGMPPPAMHPVTLSRQQRQAIQTCESESPHHRPHLFTFLGKSRPNSPRESLFRMHNGKDVLLLETEVFQVLKDRGKTKESYESLMTNALFAATPRGDNMFSYRFTEVLSAGAIPVVHSDGWVLPFHKTLVDWSRCAVVIPEAQLDQTVDILRRIDPARRCQMRQYCYEIYQKYMVNPEANIAGVLASIDAARGNRTR